MPFRHLAKMAITESSDIPILSLLYKLNKLAPPSPATKLPKTLNGPSTPPTPSRVLNDRIGLIRGDITTLAVDAIVNAANRSLLGGGGVDGAIHRAAGHGLLEECYTLNGCHTGSAKITRGYKLPCKKVVHTVGPVYDVLEPEKSERLLAGCYTKSLELAVANNCQTIAFSSISTGVYGYPSREAAPIAISTVRKFLEQDTGRKIQKVVFVTFEAKDVDAYNDFLPYVYCLHVDRSMLTSGAMPANTSPLCPRMVVLLKMLQFPRNPCSTNLRRVRGPRRRPRQSQRQPLSSCPVPPQPIHLALNMPIRSRNMAMPDRSLDGAAELTYSPFATLNLSHRSTD